LRGPDGGTDRDHWRSLRGPARWWRRGGCSGGGPDSGAVAWVDRRRAEAVDVGSWRRREAAAGAAEGGTPTGRPNDGDGGRTERRRPVDRMMAAQLAFEMGPRGVGLRS
jgi:hypothetical protein